MGLNEFFLISPEVVLALTFAFIIAAEITYSGERVRFILSIALIGLAAAFLQTLLSYEFAATQIFGGVLAIDGFSLFFKILFISLAILSIVSLSDSHEVSLDQRAEYCALLVAATLAMCLVAGSTDLILTFVSLLFLNTLCYFLSAYGRRSLLSTEASIKYLAFGAVGLALFLYALAVLFYYTHSLNIYEIHRALIERPLPYHAMLVIFLLSFLAFSFQIGAFPMTFFFPDVLEGSPTPSSSFLSIGARAAGFALMTRFFITLFSQPSSIPGQWKVLGEFDWTQVVGLASGATMGIGALLAFRQKQAKRLIAHLIVAETGFLLLGVVVLDEIGVAALLYNLVIDLFCLTGIFYVLSYLLEVGEEAKGPNGLIGRSVTECIYLVLFLLCLVGSPPLPGFIGKFTLLGVALRHHWPALVVVGIFSMVLSMAAVARLSFYLIGDIRHWQSSPRDANFSRKIFLNILFVPLVIIGLFADFVFYWAGQSLGFVTRP